MGNFNKLFILSNQILNDNLYYTYIYTYQIHELIQRATR